MVVGHNLESIFAAESFCKHSDMSIGNNLLEVRCHSNIVSSFEKTTSNGLQSHLYSLSEVKITEEHVKKGLCAKTKCIT